MRCRQARGGVREGGHLSRGTARITQLRTLKSRFVRLWPLTSTRPSSETKTQPTGTSRTASAASACQRCEGKGGRRWEGGEEMGKGVDTGEFEREVRVGPQTHTHTRPARERPTSSRARPIHSCSVVGAAAAGATSCAASIRRRCRSSVRPFKKAPAYTDRPTTLPHGMIVACAGGTEQACARALVRSGTGQNEILLHNFFLPRAPPLLVVHRPLQPPRTPLLRAQDAHQAHLPARVEELRRHHHRARQGRERRRCVDSPAPSQRLRVPLRPPGADPDPLPLPPSTQSAAMAPESPTSSTVSTEGSPGLRRAPRIPSPPASLPPLCRQSRPLSRTRAAIRFIFSDTFNDMRVDSRSHLLHVSAGGRRPPFPRAGRTDVAPVV
jgi:hypothetical protein